MDPRAVSRRFWWVGAVVCAWSAGACEARAPGAPVAQEESWGDGGDGIELPDQRAPWGALHDAPAADAPEPLPAAAEVVSSPPDAAPAGAVSFALEPFDVKPGTERQV